MVGDRSSRQLKKKYLVALKTLFLKDSRVPEEFSMRHLDKSMVNNRITIESNIPEEFVFGTFTN